MPGVYFANGESEERESVEDFISGPGTCAHSTTLTTTTTTTTTSTTASTTSASNTTTTPTTTTTTAIKGGNHVCFCLEY